MPNPKPHSNTVATILKIHIEKEFVSVQAYERLHEYHYVVSKEDYSQHRMYQLVEGYFDGSFSNVVSFLVQENNLSVKDLELLLQQLKKL